MVSERIGNSSEAPTILIADGRNNGGSRCDGPFEGGIWIFYRHHHAHGTAAQRLRTEVQMLRRFVRDPKFRFRNAQPGNHGSTLGVNAEQFASAERGLIKRDGPRSVSNRKHGSYRGLLIP